MASSAVPREIPVLRERGDIIEENSISKEGDEWKSAGRRVLASGGKPSRVCMI
jgi:hypothetical protein